MNKTLLSAAVTGVVLGATTAGAQAAMQLPQVKWFGFAQLTAQAGKAKVGNTKSSLKFGADRIRIGFKLKQDRVFGKLQVDFNKADGKSNILPNIIKDAVGGYKFNDAAKVSFGMFKTPVGMDFNVSGKALEITKRGMEKGLVLERSAGVMLSGRKILGGFGYDAGIFNPTTRSSAVSGGTPGSDNAWAIRGMYDTHGPVRAHAEVSYGTSQSAGNAPDLRDYKVWDVAARAASGPLSARAEWISGNGVQGQDWHERVWYVGAGYKFRALRPMQAVVRFYDGHSRKNGASSDLQNTYLGLNVWLAHSKYNGRLQVNYVVASGDKKTWSGVSGGKSSGGYTENVFLVQYQVAF